MIIRISQKFIHLVIQPHCITNYYQTIDTIYKKTLRDTLPIMLANFKYGFFFVLHLIILFYKTDTIVAYH